MATQIDSNKVLIREVFTRWFRVPEYQRPYIWGKDEVSDLLEDITDAQQSRPTSQYFLGSIVLQTRRQQDASGNAYDESDLLDGQQRLTTCLLLHAVARDLTTSSELKESCNKAVFQQSNPFDGIPERLRIVYDIRSEVRNFVTNHIKPEGGTAKVDALKELAKNSPDTSVRHMASAVLQIREFFGNKSDPDALNQFFQFFRTQVLLIYVSSPDLDDAFRLFTILNNRGMKLRSSDILKTQNLGALRSEGATEQEIHDSAKDWESMESDLGEDFDTFLSHVRTVLTREQARRTLLEEFEENIYKPRSGATSPVLTPGRQTFDLLKRHRSHFAQITSGNNHSNANGYLFDNLVALLKHTARADFWLPPLLYYRDTLGEEGIVPFLRRLENKFMAGWVMRETPSRRSEAMFGVLRDMERIRLNDTLSVSQKRDAMLQSPTLDFDKTEVLRRADEEAIYHEPYALYLLYKLDLIAGGEHSLLQPPANLSVEHVLPQNPATSSQWRADFSDAEREEWTHRLGNLVAIGRRKNTSLGRRDFGDKKRTYFQAHVQPFPNSLRVLQYTQWTPVELKDFHAKNVAALEQWIG